MVADPMSNPPYIFDVTPDTFASQVAAASATVPVLVAYWSPRVSQSCAASRLPACSGVRNSGSNSA